MPVVCLNRLIPAGLLLEAVLLVGSLLVAVVPVPAQVTNGTSWTAIQPESCLSVSGPRILPRDLALQDPRFGSLDDSVDLGYAPDPGAVRWLSVPGVEELSVCVARQRNSLQPEQIMEALELSGLGNVEARILSWAEEPFPAGRLRMPRSGIVAPVRGATEVLWRGSLEYEHGQSGNRRSLPVWARVHLTRSEPCLRLLRIQRRGQALEADTVETAPCDAAAIVSQALSAINAGADWRLAADLPAGTWLLPEHCTQAPVLQRGETATLAVSSGAVSLALPVVTEQAGAIGQTIWVRSVADRRRFQATVTGPQRLEVQAGASPATSGPARRPGATPANVLSPGAKAIAAPRQLPAKKLSF